MIKNYFTIALRTLWKNKTFAAINVLGLAIGISASLVIYLLVNYHFSFDRFQKDADRIYRVTSNFSFSGEVYHNSGVTDPMAEAVRREVTGVAQVIPFRTWNGEAKLSMPATGKTDPTVFKKQKNIVFADSSFFNLLGYEWLAGSPQTSLNKPYQVVLTQSNASLYFPRLNASQVVGKAIHLDDSITATVSGVVNDIKENTDFTFKTFIAYASLQTSSLKPKNWDKWDNTDGAQQLLLKLAPGTKPPHIEKQITTLYARHNKTQPGDNSKTWHALQPLSDLHFNAEYGAYDLPVANKPTLYGLLAVAVFLLLLGSINFINLTTAHAAQRAKEIGIRKTMGSSQKQLIFQFLGETFLLTVMATVLSIALMPLILKAFSGFIPAGMNLNLEEQPGIFIFLIALIMVVTILAGFYPSVVLASYKPVLVLKNQAYANTSTTRKVWLRKSLTVFQFVIAQVFIMGAILVSKQITYSLNKDLGFKKDAILYAYTNYYDTVKSNKHLLAEMWKAIPGIAMVTLSNDRPSSGSTWSGTMKYKDGKKEIEADVQQKHGDSNYIKLYQLKLLAGKNNEQSDTVKSFIINNTYARLLGFQQPGEAIGKYLLWSEKQVPIVGVVSDFHQKSLHEPIKPLAIASWGNSQLMVSVLLQAKSTQGAWKETISKMEKAWKKVYPEDEFEYHFFDESILKFYEAEQHISGLLMWATGLAIFISCLGLMGLVIYTTTVRTKEIGVRKVLGASVAQIVSLIAKDFVLLVLLAFVIATPVAVIGIHKWLENFSYRTEISWWIFLLAGGSMMVIALLTLSFKTIKSAMMNPVKSLRTE